MAPLASEQNGAEKPDEEEKRFTNLYVKYFPQDWNEKDLCDQFSGCGPIQAAKVTSDPRGRKFAFVTFEKHEDARACIEEMHRKDLRPRAERKAAKAAAAKAEAEGLPPPAVLTDVDGHPEHLLYVGKTQTRAERQAMLESKGLKGGQPKGKGKDKGGAVFYGSGKGGAATQSAATPTADEGSSRQAAGEPARPLSTQGATFKDGPPSFFQQRYQAQPQAQQTYVNGSSYASAHDGNTAAESGGSYASTGGHGSYDMSNGGYGVSCDNASYGSAGYGYDWNGYGADGGYGTGNSYQSQLFQMQMWQQQQQQQQQQMQQYWAS